MASIHPWVGALSVCGNLQLHVSTMWPFLRIHAESWMHAVPALALVCELVEVVFELVELVSDLRKLKAPKRRPLWIAKINI